MSQSWKNPGIVWHPVEGKTELHEEEHCVILSQRKIRYDPFSGNTWQ